MTLNTEILEIKIPWTVVTWKTFCHGMPGRISASSVRGIYRNSHRVRKEKKQEPKVFFEAIHSFSFLLKKYDYPLLCQ